MCLSKRGAMILAVIFFSQHTYAQGFKMMRSSSQGSKMVYLETFASIFSREFGFNGGLQLGQAASLGLEYTRTLAQEEFSDKEVKENNNSFITQGQELLLSVSRYSSPHDMTGFYWLLGLGYRELAGSWSHVENGENIYLSSNIKRDEEGRFVNEYKVSGVTAHGRVGYRYLFDSFPMTLGGYIGLRHFENKVQDVPQDSSQVFETPESKRYQMSRVLMTRLTGGLSLGVTF